MPTLAVVNFNLVCATLGGFITLFGLVSYLFKERYYLSEPLISLVAGLIFSPHATNLLRPEEYALNDPELLGTITLYFSRFVLGVQLVLAGVQLPSKYLKHEWKSLALLLGPGMTVMWLVTGLLVFAFVPHIHFLEALVVAACVAPTDPVLSNSIVKGRFADKNIPKPLQNIIVAESGANDGLGYPFLFLPLYLIQHTGYGGAGQDHQTRTAIGEWFGETWGYTIILSILYGAVVGWIAKELLHWAEERNYVDKESFLVFAIALALFIIGTVGMIGSDDVLACFVAGNIFTWDDWFRLETADDSFQPTIDMLLNVAVFIWLGAVCPWNEFLHNSVIPIYRLIFLGILVLLLRRLPIVFAMHKYIHQIEETRQAVYVGFFGPIGISAVFYLYITLEFLRGIKLDGKVRPDAEYLIEVVYVVVWFLIICSVIIHGLSVPLGKLGFWLPRTLSRAISTRREDSPEPFHVPGAHDTSCAEETDQRQRRRPGTNSSTSLPQHVSRIGRPSIQQRKTSSRAHSHSANPSVSASDVYPERDATTLSAGTDGHTVSGSATPAPSAPQERTIRYMDEQKPVSPAA